MKCTGCNQVIPDVSSYCLYCGKKVKNEPAQQKTKPRKITIVRASKFVGCAVAYQVLCDGQVVATIRNGKTITFEVDENSHIIQCCAVAPTMIMGNEFGVYGGGGNTMSDIINIPSGSQSAELLLKSGFASLKLEAVRLYLD